MSDLLELSAQYRETGLACRARLRERRQRLSKSCGMVEELELRQQITMLTAMSRDCIAISNYLKDYYGRRKENGNKDGKAAGK